MPIIKLYIKIYAPIEDCFDLARDIDFHQRSTKQTKEKAIVGKTHGLIELGEFVTWEATHFFVKQKLTSKITSYNKPFHFRDEQIKGIFKEMVHDHYFENEGECVLMTDVFQYTSPLGILGQLADFLFLKKYMKSFLSKRNMLLKTKLETKEINDIRTSNIQH